MEILGNFREVVSWHFPLVQGPWESEEALELRLPRPQLARPALCSEAWLWGWLGLAGF